MSNADGTIPPLCACHGVPKRWHKEKRAKNGGYWRCTVKWREKHQKADNKYKKSPKGQASRQRYNKSEKGKATKRRYFDSHIQFRIAGGSTTIPVPPEQKHVITEKRDEFRSQQRQEAKEA